MHASPYNTASVNRESHGQLDQQPAVTRTNLLNATTMSMAKFEMNHCPPATDTTRPTEDNHYTFNRIDHSPHTQVPNTGPSSTTVPESDRLVGEKENEVEMQQSESVT